MMRWWVDRGVDGFRMDVINLISKPVELHRRRGAAGPAVRIGVRSVANGPRLDEFLAEMNAAVGLDAQNLITVGEMPGSLDRHRAGGDRPGNHELNMVFTFEHVEPRPAARRGRSGICADLPLPVLKDNLAEWQDGLAEAGWNSLYWNNHDQPRAVSRFGDDSPEHRVASAKTLGTVLHLHRGTPYVYQGEEIGMTNSYFTDITQYQDMESVNYHAEALTLGLEAEAVLQSLSVKSRDNARTPMQWDDRSHAGFTQGIPWLPANPNYVFDQRPRRGGRSGLRVPPLPALIELRHDHPGGGGRAVRAAAADHDRLWAFTRTSDDDTLLVLANLSTEPLALPDRRAARPDRGRRCCSAPTPATDGRHPRALGVAGPAPEPRLW